MGCSPRASPRSILFRTPNDSTTSIIISDHVLVNGHDHHYYHQHRHDVKGFFVFTVRSLLCLIPIARSSALGSGLA